ncbi:MAG TPA: 3-phosphoshikimate 1-carboxyvinyltransferase [Streptosporangiaceae bacterium]|nr:3-phosphoshikimate 1-carboxyvinyltransferase [Streptosporangiaceae bacterium]
MHTGDDQDRTWLAPVAAGPVRARIALPASKSITNRALVLAALSDSVSAIANPLRARDTALAADGLRAMGTQIAGDGPDDNPDGRTNWRVTPGQPAAGSLVAVDVGNAGTVMRFLPAVAALTRATVRFDGDARASLRPVGAILAALHQLGADIDDEGRGAVPFTVRGRGTVRGGTVTLDASASSQLISGLLLAAPRFGEGVEIRHAGPPVPSAPHIAMSVRMLRAAGAEVTASSAAGGPAERPDAWRVRPGPLNLGAIAVEPDLSNAGPFLAAALVTGGTVTVPGWPRDSLQAAGPILDVLARMGARHETGEEGLTISGTGAVHGISADLRDVAELAPVLAAVAALADAPSTFTGLAHTRGHETDRLAALAKEINALGGDVAELPDGLAITPRPLNAAGEPFGSYDDHRMVMAAAVLGLVVPGLRVSGAETVAKTFPAFTGLWAQTVGLAP